jgi:hypothetical protein
MPQSIALLTSSWSTKLPSTVARIGISRGPPRRQSGYRLYTALAPGSYFKKVPVAEFRQLYMAGLENLDPTKVVEDLQKIAGGRPPVLLCFEPPEPDAHWCHRGFVSAWLHDTLGIEVYEFGQESEGFGWAHPKIPPEFRKPIRRRPGSRAKAGAP